MLYLLVQKGKVLIGVAQKQFDKKFKREKRKGDRFEWHLLTR